MDRDGTQDGYDLDLLQAVSTRVRIPVIASGGVGNLEHIYQGLTEGGASAALAASIFHFGTFTIGQAKSFLRDRGVLVR
jgi:imidazole glycerol-phosphate synthase subunit HisF